MQRLKVKALGVSSWTASANSHIACCVVQESAYIMSLWGELFLMWWRRDAVSCGTRVQYIFFFWISWRHLMWRLCLSSLKELFLRCGNRLCSFGDIPPLIYLYSNGDRGKILIRGHFSYLRNVEQLLGNPSRNVPNRGVYMKRVIDRRLPRDLDDCKAYTVLAFRRKGNF